MESYRMLIDGLAADAASGATMAVIDPGTGEAFAQVPRGDERDADRAVRAARRAFVSGVWSGLTPAARARILVRFADLIEANAGRIALADSRSNGSPVAYVAGGLWVAANTIRNLAWYAANRFVWEEELPVSGSVYAFGSNLIRHEPKGVVAAIAPWNVPHMMALWKIGHALAMGNTLVLKPASSTPISALLYAELAVQAGVPAGVLNVITGPGSGLGEALCLHPEVDKVSLTGSSEVGRRIMARAAETLKDVSLELGGKSASIVLDDADIEVAVDGAIAGNFQNAGQICISGSRLLVARPLYAELLERLARRITDLQPAYQLLPDTKLGPLASARQLETVEQYVALGLAEGARLVCGGRRPPGPQFEAGCYYEPTVFADVDNRMRIAQEEIFGPVLVVIPFDTDEEAVAIANDTRYGLAGAVWSRDILRARRVAEQVRAGTLWINDVAVLSDFAPFGGYKASGVGREFGEEGLKSYTQTKLIYTSNEGVADRGTFRSTLPFPPSERFAFCTPTKILCGINALAGLENELRLKGARRAVIITDPGVRAAGLAERVMRAAGGRCVGVFDGVVADPDYECVQAAIDACRALGADSLVSLGGGSSIDAAKLTLVALTNGGSAEENIGLLRLAGPQLPHIAIPTTHGTGSEVTLGAVITNRQLHRKFFLADPHVIPDVAILDPVLVTGLPRAISIGTGLDALTHAIEGVVTPAANPITRSLGLEAIRLVARHLPTVAEDGQNLPARQGMLVASTLAGIALGPGLGIAHAYAHTVGSLLGVHHGTACGIGLPHAMRFNREHATEALGQVAEALGVDTRGMSALTAADAAAVAVEALMARIGAPRRLADLGLDAARVMAQFEALVTGVMSDLNNSSNPRPVREPAAVIALIQATV